MLAQGIMRDIEDWEDVIIVFAQVEKVRSIHKATGLPDHLYCVYCRHKCFFSHADIGMQENIVQQIH